LKRLLFTAGPVEVRQEVLDAMRFPMITHRGGEYKELHHSIVERMQRLLRTDNDILLFVSSATGAMEAAVRSGVQRKIMHLVSGAFGERWVEISKTNGKEVIERSVPWGAHISDCMGDVPEDVEAVAVTHNETSTGVMNPLEQIAEDVHSRSDALLLVDAVTSAFAVDIDMKKVEPDFLLFGTQKALALPPGLAFGVVSQRYLERCRKVTGRGRYFDVLEIKEFADRHLCPSTPPISLMYALDFQLERIEKEGMKQRAARHHELGELARTWARERMSLFPQSHFSETVTCVRNTAGIDYASLSSALAERGFQISEGYGKLKKETFRIGHMGDITVEEMRSLLAAMDEVI
jgi:predicted phosphoserine aminotransferase